jgi:hypothetical protein
MKEIRRAFPDTLEFENWADEAGSLPTGFEFLPGLKAGVGIRTR